MKNRFFINGPCLVSKLSLLVSLIFIISTSCTDYKTVDSASVSRYILSCQKSNGGFGPLDMEYTDLAWTYPAVHALTILGSDIPNHDSCYKNGGQSWIEKVSWRNGPWYWSLHQKANLYKVINRTGPLEDGFLPDQEWLLQFKPRTNYTEFREYTDGYFFDMASLWNVVEAIDILNGTIENKDYVENYILPRQTISGGFDDMLGDRISPENDRSHIMVTHDAVMVLNTLDISIPSKSDLIDWIRSCQTAEGGFQWHPDHISYSNKADVWYTWAAVRALKVLGAEPLNVDDCIEWLNSLQNYDGGFGDRPGWSSRLYSTYYAIHSLEMLTGDIEKAISEKKMTKNNKTRIPEGKYSIFQAHHKSPPGGTEMVDTVVSIGLNLIAVKTTEAEVVNNDGISEVVRKAREYARGKGYTLEIVDSPENHRHRFKWLSGMEGNHISNFMIPPDLSMEERNIYLSAYDAGIHSYDWHIFKEKVIRPMMDFGTLFYPELDYTMLNAYMVYDEGLDGNIGFNGVPAAHFGNYDWVRHFPYKERWIGQLPMIADGDAHGDIYEWRYWLDSFRNVYIAKSHNYYDYIDASLNGRSVCVIRFPETGEVRYYGSAETIDYLKRHKVDWKWWHDE